jgi:hypothetical protein
MCFGFPNARAISDRGVAHDMACEGSGWPPAPKLWFGPPFSPSDALGAAHMLIAVARSEFGRPVSRRLVSAPPLDMEAVGHTEDEKPFALMRRTDLSRLEQSDLTRKTKSAQVSPYALGAAAGEHAADIFDEDEPRPGLDDDAPGRAPEIALVVFGEPLPSETVRLARDAANEAVNAATPSAAVEGSGIAPDRSLIHETRSHRCDQVRDGEGFPLHQTDAASAWQRQSDAEIKPAPPLCRGRACRLAGHIEPHSHPFPVDFVEMRGPLHLPSAAAAFSAYGCGVDRGESAFRQGALALRHHDDATIRDGRGDEPDRVAIQIDGRGHHAALPWPS